MKLHRKLLRRLLPAAALNRLNAWSHLEDRLFELEARYARLAEMALRPQFPGLFPPAPAGEFAVFSQNGEDGILLSLLNRIDTPVKTFAEVGIEHGRECNTAILGLVLGWDGLWLEADPLSAAAAQRLVRRMLKDRPNQIHVRCLAVTPDNIDSLLGGGELGVLSIDVDGPDYWLWRAVRSARPQVVIVEYNASFGPDASITVPYLAGLGAAEAHWSGYYHGASLAALEKLGRAKGYDLVAVCSAGVNAFFVREDLRPVELRARRACEIYRPHASRSRRHSPHEQWELIRNLPYEQV